MPEWLDRFFRTDDEVSIAGHREDMENAVAVVAIADMPYFKRHIAWLESQANRPLPLGDHVELVKSAVRSNTLREVREHLLAEIRQAAALIAAERQSNG